MPERPAPTISTSKCSVAVLAPVVFMGASLREAEGAAKRDRCHLADNEP
jgi:hypothetical protein